MTLTRTARLALLLCGAGVLASSCAVFGDPEETFTDGAGLGDVRTVRLDNPDGSVTVRSGDRPSVRRTVHHYDDQKPGRTYTDRGSELVLSGCGEDFPGCYVDYTVTVPDSARVTGNNDSGRVELTGVSSVDMQADSGKVALRDIAGAATVRVDSGEVDLDGVGGAVNVQADSGRVRGARIAGGDVTVAADSGEIRLGLTDPRTVRVMADSGRVELTVPRRTYRMDVRAADRRPDIAVPTDRNAERRITVGADSGEVSVHT